MVVATPVRVGEVRDGALGRVMTRRISGSFGCWWVFWRFLVCEVVMRLLYACVCMCVFYIMLYLFYFRLCSWLESEWYVDLNVCFDGISFM